MAGTPTGDSTLVAFASTEMDKISIWDTRMAAAGRVLQHRASEGASTKSGQCMSLLFHSGGRLLLSGYEDGSIDGYDMIAGRWVGETKGSLNTRKFHKEPVLGLTKIVRGRTISKEKTGRPTSTLDRCISCGADGRMCIFDPDTLHSGLAARSLEEAVECPTSSVESKGLNQVSVRSDGRIVAAASWTGYVYVHDAFKGFKLLCPVPASAATRAGTGGRNTGGGVNCVAFGSSPSDWWHFATATNDKRIMIWDLYSPQKE